ncbi:tryptophan-rich sensory protein [Arthrobacter sp. NamB2]|uniref:tryptophan-rich sensory protein n=1 Tax=Arthrobacter sp. NamB2 TaxID=2576035 RepID=UPI0016793170|nr:tryptophan-rich sensory protein [Arthrobacter sp. NamB2]
MSTPKNPGPRLPDKPVRPPSITVPASAAEDPAGTASALERLKAAQPRAAQTAETADDHEQRPPQTAAVARTAVGADGGGTSAGATGGTSTETSTETSDAAERLRRAAARARTAAGTTGSALSSGSRATVHRVGTHVGSWNPDVVRQTVVTVCAVACIVGSAAGVGAFGGPSIRDAAGGVFAPDATLLAPSSSAFAIWSVIYAGLVAFTVFQWLPSQRESERQRRLGWAVAASMLLNLAWILTAQADRLTMSLVVILLLFLVLLAAVRTLNDHPNESRLEGVLVDTPIGLYLGWVLVAAAANGAALLAAEGVELFGWKGSTWAIVGIAAILITAAIICSTDRGRIAVAAATSWGLLWIAVERVLGQPFAADVAFAAGLAIFLLLITAGSRRHRVDHAHRRWLRAQEDARREPLDLLGDDDYETSRY